MEHYRPVNTPMEVHKTLQKHSNYSTDKIEFSSKFPYREAIGSLMCLMIGTCPDLAYAVGNLSQFCESPAYESRTAVNRVMTYCGGTLGLGVCVCRVTALALRGFSDSDWAGDL